MSSNQAQSAGQAGGILKQGSRPVNAGGWHTEHLGRFTHRKPLHPLQVTGVDSFAASSQSFTLASSPSEPRVDAFSNPFPLKLCEAAQYAEHEPSGGAARVDAFTQRREPTPASVSA